LVLIGRMHAIPDSQLLNCNTWFTTSELCILSEHAWNCSFGAAEESKTAQVFFSSSLF
jgi:hypothetical protein